MRQNDRTLLKVLIGTAILVFLATVIVAPLDPSYPNVTAQTGSRPFQDTGESTSQVATGQLSINGFSRINNETVPCGIDFQLAIYLQNFSGGSWASNITVTVQDAKGLQIFANNGTKTDEYGLVLYTIVTPVQPAPLRDTVTASASFEGQQLTAFDNLTVSIQAVAYQVSVGFAYGLFGSSYPARSGSQVPLEASVMWRAYPIEGTQVVVTDGHGNILANFLYESEQKYWNVTAPSVASETTFNLVVTASLVGVVLAQSQTTLVVAPAPALAPGFSAETLGGGPFLVTIAVAILFGGLELWAGRRGPGTPLVFAVAHPIAHKGEERRTTVGVWNRGRRTILPDSVEPDGCLLIGAPRGSRVGPARSLAGDRSLAHIEVSGGAGEANPRLRFDCWPPLDGAVFSITSPRESTSEVRVFGGPKGGVGVIQYERTPLKRFARTFDWLPLALWIFGLVAYAYYLPTLSPPSTLSAVLAIVLLAGQAVAITLLIWFGRIGAKLPSEVERAMHAMNNPEVRDKSESGKQ